MEIHLQVFLVFTVFLGNILPLESSPMGSGGGSLQNDQDTFTCDPLRAEGTLLLCFPPSSRPDQEFDPSTDCSGPSIPRTIASYSCRGARNAVYTGFLNCASTGVWVISLQHANNSLCNLDASILNLEMPDVVMVTELPEFTTPTPHRELMQPDLSSLSGYEALALQLHNTFRRNHGVPMIEMTEQLNQLAQQFADSIISGGDITLQDNVEANFKLNPVHSTTNVEMNWYFQVPTSPNNEEAVSNAVQSWYSGFLKYDWQNVERNLDGGDESLAFARVIWRATRQMVLRSFMWMIPNMKHEEIEAALEEIGRHNKTINFTDSQQINHDMDVTDGDEFRYEILIFFLVVCMLIILVMAQSLIAFGAKARVIPKTSYERISS